MNGKPRKAIHFVSKLALIAAALFSAMNAVFPLFTERMMPMALTMPRYLAKFGILKAEVAGSSFYSVFCIVSALVLCAVFALCPMLAGKNRGFLAAAAVLFLIDCAGVAVLIAANGFVSGYWFEIAGHAAILLFLLIALVTVPRKDKLAEQ